MTFGNTVGSVGQQGTNSGNVAVGHQWNGKRQMTFRNTAGNVGQQGTNSRDGCCWKSIERPKMKKRFLSS